jgi:hypothetical protein
LQSGDGITQNSSTILAPENNYAHNAAYALVSGELHIFGGSSDGYKVIWSLYSGGLKFNLIFKIAKLDGCSLNELPQRLGEERIYYHAALSIEGGKKGQKLKKNYLRTPPSQNMCPFEQRKINFPLEIFQKFFYDKIP